MKPVRLHHVFRHDNGSSSSVHWKALKQRVMQRFQIEPFAQVDDIRAQGFHYLSSKQHADRFEILEGDAPYSGTVDWVPDLAQELPADAGPVEIDVAGFMLDPRPDLGVLIGGMGSGKSTTLRQITAWLAKRVRVHYLNCDKKAHDPVNPPPAVEVLGRFLGPLADDLIDPEEEFGACWDWALERYGREDTGDSHSATEVLNPAVAELKRTYGSDWRRNDAQAVAFRRERLHALVCAGPMSELEYIAMRVDYYLTEVCKGQRNRLCIVLDNVDPLPPKLQRDLLLRSSELQLNARCKIMLAMRPLTYSLTHEQRATRTVKVIQHIGPPALQLIEDRIVRLIETPDLANLKLRVQGAGSERELTQQDFKAWVRQVFEDIRASRPPGGNRSPDPSASDFIEGLCNNSLRSALLVAEKIFGSPNLPMVLPDEPANTDGSHATILKNHEIIRAVLLGKHEHFTSDLSRVTDNIFDLGDATPCFSPTCKIRVLKELAGAPGRGILTLDEVRKRLSAFGYDEQTVLEGVNGVISQVKRLAWSDMVTVYQSLAEPPGSKLSISRAGRFYVDQAIYSLEYVQEVHVDVLLPEDVARPSYNHRNFVERIDSLYRFMRYVHQVDLHEVRNAMSDPSARQRYHDTYGAHLFSSDMASAIARQVLTIGNSILRRPRLEERLRFATKQALVPWETLDDLIAREDEDVLLALKPIERR